MADAIVVRWTGNADGRRVCVRDVMIIFPGHPVCEKSCRGQSAYNPCLQEETGKIFNYVALYAHTHTLTCNARSTKGKHWGFILFNATSMAKYISQLIVGELERKVRKGINCIEININVLLARVAKLYEWIGFIAGY